VKVDDFAVDLNRAGIGLDRSCENLDESRLSGAVLTDEGMDLALSKVE
jgi:hypothetical protein